MKRLAAPLAAGAVLALGARTAYRLVAEGALTLDLGLGRRLQALGPLVQTIRAPPEVVFDTIAGPYLGRTPRALADKLNVWERGSDMVLAAHFTPVTCGVTTTLETVRFRRPERIDFRVVRRTGAARRRIVPAHAARPRHRASLAGRVGHGRLGNRGMVGRQGRARLDQGCQRVATRSRSGSRTPRVSRLDRAMRGPRPLTQDLESDRYANP